MKSTRCALFEGLSDGEISFVAEKIKFEYKTFSRGEEIFVYGSDDGKLCHLAEGVAETIRTDENGAVALIERFSAGAAFGYGEGKELGGLPISAASILQLFLRDFWAIFSVVSKKGLPISPLGRTFCSEKP